MGSEYSIGGASICDFGMSFSGGHHEGLLGMTQSWHDNVAHISKTNDSIAVGSASVTTRQAFIQFDRFWAGHVAYLAKRLSTIKEGSGTMLDNTLMVWGVESGTNHNHSPRDMQYLLIGGRNLGIKTGQYLKLPSTQSSNKLLTSIMNAFGYAATGIGIEPTVGPLAGVLYTAFKLTRSIRRDQKEVMAELSIDLRRRLVEAYQSKKSGTYAATAALFGVGEATVSRTLRRHRETGDVVYKPKGGNNPRRVDLEWLRGHLAREPEARLIDRIEAWKEHSGKPVSLGAMWLAVRACGWTHKKKRWSPVSKNGRTSRPGELRSQRRKASST